VSGQHWAACLIGKPWERGACGPDAFDCWGLVRHVLATAHGLDVPVTAADVPGAARALGWIAVPSIAPLAGGDVVLMRNAQGERHVGIVVQAGSTVGVLHAVRGTGVRFDTLQALPAQQFHSIELWRHAPCSRL